MKRIYLTDEMKQEILTEVAAQLNKANVLKEVKYTIPTIKTQGEKVQLTIEESEARKMQALVSQCDKEVAWHGTVVRTEKGFHIQEIFVFPQIVTGASVNVNDSEYAMWQMNTLNTEQHNSLRFHGHSHVNMGVSPSGTDDDYQRQLLEGIRDFYIYGIFNKRRDAYFLIYDVENNTLYENSDIQFGLANDQKEWAEEQIAQHVVENKPATTVGKMGGYHQARFNEDGYSISTIKEPINVNNTVKIQNIYAAPEFDRISLKDGKYAYGKHYNNVTRRWEIPTYKTMNQFSESTLWAFEKQLDAYEDAHNRPWKGAKNYYGQK